MTKHILIFFIPLILSNILHMIVVKRGLLSFLNRPFSKKLFGENKTWRGLIFVSLLTAWFVFIFNFLRTAGLEMVESLSLGALLGLGYIVSELPNSYLKRKMGIPPGEKPEKLKLLFVFLDRFDSAFGSVLVYSLLVSLSITEFLQLLTLSILIHFLFSYLLYVLGIKKAL